MEQFMGIAALLVAVGGVLTVLVVLGGPVVHRQFVVLRLRSGLHRIDHVLAAWEHEAATHRPPYRGI